jgi:signal transduction histidine kinase
MSGVWPQLARRHGFNASAAVPIVIRGALWGALVAVGRSEAFPLPIEEHLANFAELAGTAVSAADARQELRLLADEQAALRRLAELVARGAALDEVFSAAATEASLLLGKLAAALMRYDGNTAVVVAVCNSPVPLGLGVPIDDHNALGTLRRTGRPARTDNFTDTSLAEAAIAFGVGAGVAVPVTVEGRVWGALTASTPDLPLPAGSEERLTPFAELVAAAIGNAQNKAKLTASRARVVATADETRRRLQRDVHDGAQQRLVHTIIALKLARDVLGPEHPAAVLLQEGLNNAERANSELRDIIRGILPASLTHGGLRSGLETLVTDLALPVDLTVATPRLPAHIETTAYFVVAEAMTNVVKHAHAHRATVDVRVDDQTLVLDIRDDGVGGADPTAGSGIAGLFDRVEANDGTLTVTSSPGAGTAIHAAIPVREHAAANYSGDISVSL